MLRVSLTNEQLYPREIEDIDGIRCMVPVRALFDEVRRVAQRSLREAVVAADMASAAGVLTIDDFREYVAARTSWTGVPVAREAVALASDGSWSPQETRLRLVWVLDAGLALPMCNVPVYDLEGRLIGIPDLFDAEAGLAGEYAGSAHRDARRHRRDVEREADFRDHGIECVTVVEGELIHRSARGPTHPRGVRPSSVPVAGSSVLDSRVEASPGGLVRTTIAPSRSREGRPKGGFGTDYPE